MNFFDRLRQAIEQRKKPAAATASPEQGSAGSESVQERRKRPRQEAEVGARILVIDDSATILSLLGRLLRQNQFEVIEAIDGETGLEKAVEHNPDLIFVDIVLPGISGFEVLRKLRKEPVTPETPVIMISGNEQATEQFYVQRIGADDFMKKPFSRAEVFARIATLVNAGRLPARMLEDDAAQPVADPAPAADSELS